MATVAKKWTIDEVWDLPDDSNRYEIIAGELLVTPAPAERHQIALLRLGAALLAYRDAQRHGEVLVAPTDVVLGPDTLVQPDIVVFPERRRGSPRDRMRSPNPALAVEILSPSTARRDRIVKRALYRREGFPEYWIVDLDARAIERWTPADERPEIVSGRIEWRAPDATQPFVLDLELFFEQVEGEDE